MLAPYPLRLRSNSSPPRPRPPLNASQGQNAGSSNPSRSPSVLVPVPSSNSSPINHGGSPSMPKEKSLAASPSRPRKIFRFKRPSSSSSALQPTYERELLGPSLSSNRDESSAPPRPPRNPARAASSRRPQSSSGVTPFQVMQQASIPQSRSPMRSFLPTDNLAFALSASPFVDTTGFAY